MTSVDIDTRSMCPVNGRWPHTDAIKVVIVPLSDIPMFYIKYLTMYEVHNRACSYCMVVHMYRR